MTTQEEVISAAIRAPSVHNTQPWLWRIDGDQLHLFADRSHQLINADPVGRNLVLSCGAALHHAQVAANASGRPTQLTLMPSQNPDHLATLTLMPGHGVAGDSVALQALAGRRTDRRRFTSWPVSAERLTMLAESIQSDGVAIMPITDVTPRIRTALLVARAATRAAAWPADSVQESEHSSTIEPCDGLLALCTPGDSTTSWLQAGMALSALWLQATTDGFSIVPLSQVVEVEETRLALRYQVLGGALVPQILVRVGWQELGRSQHVPTQRRKLEDVLIS